jgi:hypothetical protein
MSVTGRELIEEAIAAGAGNNPNGVPVDVERLRAEGWEVTDEGVYWCVARAFGERRFELFSVKMPQPGSLAALYDHLAAVLLSDGREPGW